MYDLAPKFLVCASTGLALFEARLVFWGVAYLSFGRNRLWLVLKVFSSGAEKFTENSQSDEKNIKIQIYKFLTASVKRTEMEFLINKPSNRGKISCLLLLLAICATKPSQALRAFVCRGCTVPEIPIPIITTISPFSKS